MRTEEPAYKAAKIISTIKRDGGTKHDAEKELGQTLDDDLWNAMFQAQDDNKNKRMQLS